MMNTDISSPDGSESTDAHAEKEHAQVPAPIREASEHKIFVRFYVEKADPNEIKRWALEEFKITARQYNAIIYDLKGRVTAQAEHQKRHAETLAGQIKATKVKIAELETMLLMRDFVSKNDFSLYSCGCAHTGCIT